MSKTRASLLKRLPRLAARAMQGSLSEVFLPCGKKTCGCQGDRERWHGPHLYLKFKTLEGKQTFIYVPRSHEKEVRQAAEAWRELWDTIVALSDQNPMGRPDGYPTGAWGERVAKVLAACENLSEVTEEGRKRP